MILVDRPAWLAWQKEFFSLAASVLCCHLVYQGGRGYGKGYGDLHKYDPESVLIGELSYGVEMHLMIQELKSGRLGDPR